MGEIVGPALFSGVANAPQQRSLWSCYDKGLARAPGAVKQKAEVIIRKQLPCAIFCAGWEVAMMDTMEPAVRDRMRVLEIAKPDCVADDFGGEVVVLNIATGVYFSLTDLAAEVWRDLAAGHPVDSLLAGINRVDERIAEATATLIDDFERAGLMRRSSRPLATTLPESIALVRKGEARLTIEAFEDMKDLILSDPIHDVDDQAAWPTLQRTGKN